MIAANDLITLFRRVLSEEWGYIWGTAGETWTQEKQDAATREQTVEYGQKWVGHRVADCSGLFYWAFRQLGVYMYHGSNTMMKAYSTANGTLRNGKRTDGEILKPGTALYKYNPEDGYYHVGLFIGNGLVIEAKGTIYGVVCTKVSDGWTHWGELKGVDYTKNGGADMASVLYSAKVTTASGALNVRKTAGKTAPILSKLDRGSVVDVIGESDGWLQVQSDDLTGWCDASFLTREESDEDSSVKDAGGMIITDSEGNSFRPIGAFTVRTVND